MPWKHRGTSLKHTCLFDLSRLLSWVSMLIPEFGACPSPKLFCRAPCPHSPRLSQAALTVPLSLNTLLPRGSAFARVRVWCSKRGGLPALGM